VLEVFATNIFDAKVILLQVEPDGPCSVFPEARCVGLFKVSMACQPKFDKFVGKDAGLWEILHTCSDFHVDITINGLFA
jgi:hypothetical protein